MCAPIAKPNLMARSTAPLFSTGNTPGNARLTASACVFGSAPKLVDAAENILLLVESWVCTSRPMTISHSIFMSLQPDILRNATVMIRHQLVLMRNVQHLRLGEIITNDLQPNRTAVSTEAGRDRHPR